MRVVFDTNIWISFAIGKRLNKMKSILLDDQIKIFSCPEIVREFLRVSKEEKLKKYLSNQRISETIDLMETFAQEGIIKSKVSISRDVNDDYLLAFSRDNKLDYLVTGDKDLLVIKQYFNTQIITFNQFIEVINS